MLIENISSPSDLKKLSAEDLARLAEELRSLIIETVARNGGHLASNLGVIELTLALHMVFDTPVDKIIWDVGHQSYAHKLLTGRRDRFATIRKDGGLSGFPKRYESDFDAFGTGHSSTSISSALGIIEAGRRKAEPFKVVAVIGDGAMTGGLAFEGMNNAGHLKKDLIVILNDNEMSISPNVGALAASMNRILTGEFYRRFKQQTKTFLEGIPRLGLPVAKIAHKAEELLKGIVLPGILFEELGFEYIGPIDGHDVDVLVATLRHVKSSKGPTLLHVITKKGKGYLHSEKNPSFFHGVGPFEPETGSQIGVKEAKTYSETFGEAITGLARDDRRIVAITAAMKEGTGLTAFAGEHPDRFYDVGIAESHAVTFAAGMATQGLRPVVCIYSTFLQRAYDQIVHDVCLQNLPVVFAIDRSGIVGEDGPTHHGVFDISFLRHIPNLVSMAPADGAELNAMLAFALRQDAPCAVRFSRGKVPHFGLTQGGLDLGKGELLLEGSDILLIGIGNTVIPALRAAERLRAEGISAAVLNARFIKPLDRDLILSLARRTPRIITIEDNVLQGGFGSAVSECLADAEVCQTRLKRIGLPDVFIEQGTPAELHRRYGLDDEGIAAAALTLMREQLSSNRP